MSFFPSPGVWPTALQIPGCDSLKVTTGGVTEPTDRLSIKGHAESLVVGEGSHGNGQLADGPQVDGLLVGGLDEGIHPPVGPL